MEMALFDGKRILVTGGTGSLAKVLIRRLMTGEQGMPKRITVFSRDEAKQFFMKLDLEKAYGDKLKFMLGDVRDPDSVVSAVSDADMVFNAAALKQVPACEYAPFEAVMTNVVGAQNIARAIGQHGFDVEAVVGISTDKACKPVNVMGMTKAIQERVMITANLDCPDTRFICVRYGNVLASRGSVIPYFHEQILKGGPVTITTADMTRFLLSLDRAVDTIFTALAKANRGEIYVPKVRSARVVDLADVLIGDRPIKKKITGIRPGEKIHEILVSEEEAHRTENRGDYFAITPIVPEIRKKTLTGTLKKEYSSADTLMSKKEIQALLKKHGLLVGDMPLSKSEILV